MSAWSNIEVSRGDAEITSINKLEDTLGSYPDHVRQIRELITRFEMCHFKYQQHLKNLNGSIKDLHPYTVPDKIGQNHIQHGDKAWKSDNTGRTLMGQQYLWSMHNWLDNSEKKKPPEYNEQLSREVKAWLGERSTEKDNLVRLLLARLKWDWKTLEELSQKSMEVISRQGDDRGLEYQIYRMDICHFAFPDQLINILRGIGKMRPVDNFEGCGTYNSSIRKAMHAELTKINHWLLSRKEAGIAKQDQEELTRIWLFACLAKTMKEQVGLKTAITIPAYK
jgi:hypothetical protein